MTDPDQYDGFATLEELNLSPEEIETLRNNKKQITEYASEKIRALAKEGILKYNDALQKLAE